MSSVVSPLVHGLVLLPLVSSILLFSKGLDQPSSGLGGPVLVKEYDIHFTRPVRAMGVAHQLRMSFNQKGGSLCFVDPGVSEHRVRVSMWVYASVDDALVRRRIKFVLDTAGMDVESIRHVPASSERLSSELL